MDYKPELKTFSSQEWVDVVLENFDQFLIEHADGERKVASNFMGLIAKYPDREEIIPEIIEQAIDELKHFKMVYNLMQKRGISLRHNLPKDEYSVALIKKAHSGREERFLDRLLIVSISETRGMERFQAIEDALEDPELKQMYRKIRLDEAKHGHIFTKMALVYFDEKTVFDRLKYWVDIEDEIFRNLPIRPGLH